MQLLQKQHAVSSKGFLSQLIKTKKVKNLKICLISQLQRTNLFSALPMSMEVHVIYTTSSIRVQLQGSFECHLP